MKKLSVTLVLTAGLLFGFAINSSAQSNIEEVDLIQSAFGMDKKEMLTEFLQLSSDDPFWAIYDSYESERKELGKQRLDLLNRYATNYANLSDEEVDSYMKEIMKLKKSTDKLIDTYYKKAKKASGSKTAAQFYEIEYYILNVLRLTILDNIPFFGELDD